MKVFISWSGERSQALAQAVRKWLQFVLHYVEPWMSETDISAGERWAQSVAKELELCQFGIICVTPENLGSHWLLFEAGALAKSMQGRVVPLLYDLELTDVGGPLSQFQAKKITKAGLTDIALSINTAFEKRDSDERVRGMVDAVWSKFEEFVEEIPDEAPSAKHMRPQHEVLEELVAGVRGLDSRFQDLEGTFGERSVRSRRRRRIHPMMFEELSHLASEEGNDPIGLLMFASTVKDELPWLYELVVDVYHELKSGDAKAAQKAIERARRVARMMRHGPMMDFMMDDSKESHMLMMEFPRMLDHMLHRFEPRRLEGGTESTAEDTDISDS